MDRDKMLENFEEEFGEKGSWLYRCATNDRSRERTIALYEQAVDMLDFIESVENDAANLIDSQFYGELSKLKMWEPYVASDNGSMIVYADAGSVKIGDLEGKCAFLFPNGYGDGSFRLHLCDRDQFNRDCFDLVGTFEGTVRVYQYDCEPLSPAKEGDLIVTGRRFVYSSNGTVVICPM